MQDPMKSLAKRLQPHLKRVMSGELFILLVQIDESSLASLQRKNPLKYPDKDIPPGSSCGG